MKKHLAARSRIVVALVAGTLGTAMFTVPHMADAQDASDKIRLMAETLRARDSGDLSTAQKKAEELIKVAPDDTNVQRLLASINQDLERRGTGGAVYGQAASTSSVEETMAPAAEAVEEVEEAPAEEAKMEKVDPFSLDISEISPEFVEQAEVIRDLLTRGRAQFLNGDYDGAAKTFKEVEARDANNAEAKLFSTRIAQVLGGIHQQNLIKTREQMLTEVDQQWERPKVFDITEVSDEKGSGQSIVQRKMNEIVIPQVNFSGMELTRVVETLSELSLEYDAERRGVNIVPLFNPNESNPRVNISLRNLNLDRILQFVTQQVNFTYEVGADAVTIAPSFGPAGGQSTVTEFFPISSGTVIRLTGFGDAGGSSAGPVDPFAPAASSGSGPSSDDKTDALQAFFQRAGVNFQLPGASLAFDGEQLIATQTRQNLDRMRTILRNYSEVKQVEIEAKFLEVSQNDLDEIGFDWTVTNNGKTVAQFNPRSLNDGFKVDSDTSRISISSPASIITDGEDVLGVQDELDLKIPVLPPAIPDTLDFASDVVSNTFAKAGLMQVGNYDVDVAIRALSRKTGSDLMSAPKVTVLNQKRATITVAQELRFPTSYGDIESTASSGGSSNNNGSSGGRSAISITAGTPEDFETRNVGVELSVTPTVGNDDTISLVLEPRVTEFEGFVEYGGPSVAIAGDTTVTVPAGFYQPVFSTREISTEVTIYDGATLVMGGLTRDEVKTISDKVPVLGDIPGVGRLFRSEGETRQKRNLLIFVTANLVSPGGSPARQSYRNAKANQLFQNPTIMTPSGAVNRNISVNSAE